MQNARSQAEREPFCPINLDYIFVEPKDDPLLPWLEQRDKNKNVANSEEENYPELIRKTTQSHPQTIMEAKEGGRSATRSKHKSKSSTDSSEDDNGSGGPNSGGELGVGGTSETVMSSTYPQSPQSLHGSQDREKSPILQQEEEDEEDEGEDQQPPRMQAQSSWGTGYPYAYGQYYEQYLPQPQPPSAGANSYNYVFGFPPPQYGYGYEQYSNNNNNKTDNDENPARHSF